MAICAILAKKHPYESMDISATSDISGRYLQLAREGYFTQPLCAVIHGLRVGGQILQNSILALKQFGQTSGCDILHGMDLMLQHIQPNMDY